MKTYQRVIPRDLFNEAKLLKCMGLLSLKILDGLTPCSILIDECGEPFKIERTDEGGLYVSNYKITVNGIPCHFFTTSNNKEPYPFYVYIHNYEEIPVFDDAGEFSPEFIEFCTN